jgi:hypothetical protein
MKQPQNFSRCAFHYCFPQADLAITAHCRRAVSSHRYYGCMTPELAAQAAVVHLLNLFP